MARMPGRARYRPVDRRDDGLMLDASAAHQQQRAREARDLEREIAEAAAEYGDEALELADLYRRTVGEDRPEP